MIPGYIEYLKIIFLKYILWIIIQGQGEIFFFSSSYYQLLGVRDKGSLPDYGCLLIVLIIQGKGVAVAAVGSDTASQNMKAQVVNLKRENNEANTRIKHLELELKKGGGRPGTSAAGGDDVSLLYSINIFIYSGLENKLLQVI